MRPADSQPALDADVLADAALIDRGAAWRLPRMLAAITAAAPAACGRDETLAAASHALVVEPGRGLVGRAVAGLLPAGSRVTVIAGLAEDGPAAPGATLDEAFVERRRGAADVDLRAASPAGWPLEADEAGTVDLAVIAGGLAPERELDPLLEEARAALRPHGRLVLVDDDAAALAMHPPVPLFEAAWRRRLTRRAARGHDAAMVRRVPERLDRHRLRPVSAGMLMHGGVAGESDFAGVIALLADLLVDGPAGPVAGELRFEAAAAADETEGAAAEVRGAIDALARWSRRPGAAAWWPLLWVAAERAD